jgi:putative FmdB family regulatory protein
MPVYDYKCAEHGLFHELATMEDASKPCACPQCGKASARVVMIPPSVLTMAPAKKASMERNEEAKHQPIISTVDSRAEAADRAAFVAKKQHHHGKGCGCSHEHAPENSALKQQVVYLPDGSKVFPSQRPWMISH